MNTKLKNLIGTLSLSLLSLVSAFAQTAQEGFDHLNAERTKEAKEVFTKLAESAPTIENLYNLGYFYVRTNQLDEAQKAFEKGAALDEKEYLNQIGLATVAIGKGDKAKAQEIIANAEKKTRGKDAQILFRAGEAYTLFEKNNDPAEAIRLLDAAIKRDNTLADAYLAKGDALLSRNEGGPAVTSYEYALTAKPNYAVANNKIGQVYLRGKNYNQALDFYKKAIEASPDFAPAYKDLAELYFLARQYKRAAENFDLYIQKSGNDDPKTVLRAAQFAFTADEYSRSLELLEGIKGKINDPITKRMYGWAYYKTNDMEKAIENLEGFLKEAPEKVISDDYKYLGRAYNKMATEKEYTPQGMEYLMKGAELDTNITEAATTFKEIAGIYYKDKDYEKAATAYVKGVGMDTAKATTNDYFQMGLAYFQGAQAISVPDSATADSAALAQQKRETYLKADSAFTKVSVLQPEWPYGYYWRASALYNAYDRQENIDKGISAPHYEKFIELAEKDDASKYKSYLRLAYSYLAFYYQTTMKDEAKAKELWGKLLQIDPNNQAAKQALGVAQAVPADSTNKQK
ncbi:tetratricopeptide repeat protein [Arundinibacter roseus]|uniref:Tetratricopeptide repeat protein n=1 Tax=Arundinibacter roseus TaxID=2070510 RepID=A0A4R4K0T9_9BACT|nr:tetratricopeptide repeat protein [Arundinibacter roseus]TDB60840.1 tetratricopeptide repeat protein [Arundinibacter roseus]